MELMWPEQVGSLTHVDELAHGVLGLGLLKAECHRDTEVFDIEELNNV